MLIYTGLARAANVCTDMCQVQKMTKCCTDTGKAFLPAQGLMSGPPHLNRLGIGIIKMNDSADLHRPGQSSLHKHDVCQSPSDFLRPVFGKLSLLGHHTWD